MLGQIKKHLFKWARTKFSLASKIMVSNQVILSSIWYLASCTDFSSQALNLAQTTVRNYIWLGKKESKYWKTRRICELCATKTTRCWAICKIRELCILPTTSGVLGCIISNEGFSMDQNKIHTITNWLNFQIVRDV